MYAALNNSFRNVFWVSWFEALISKTIRDFSVCKYWTWRTWSEIIMWALTEHRLAFILNMNAQYEDKCKYKSNFKSKHIKTSIRKEKEIGKQSSHLLRFLHNAICELLLNLDHFYTAYLHHNLTTDSTSLVCTLVVEGLVSEFEGWHYVLRHKGFHLQTQLWVFYTSCWVWLTSWSKYIVY